MNYTKLIADLCEIVDKQNAIIQAQAETLAQFDALTMAEEITAMREKYARTMGEEVNT